MILGKIKTKVKCNKCGEIMPLAYYGTLEDLQKNELKDRIEEIRRNHKCKKLKDITLIEEYS